MQDLQQSDHKLSAFYHKKNRKEPTIITRTIGKTFTMLTVNTNRDK